MTRATLLRPVRVLSMALVLGLALAATADEGQGPGDTSKSTLGQVTLGDYWYGAKITKEDLQGKVVLFDIWGS
ncbi:MAG: hypothetical protein P1V36_14315 [Planctomycetota bacterium]|nr:hypothetical protein [Planctomycetota bacterium]